MPITHKQVNLFDSEAVFLLHQVNCRGVMGSGIAKQVRERYPEVYEAYRALCDGRDTPSDARLHPLKKQYSFRNAEEKEK